MTEPITPEELQAWADSLGERESAMLRTIMEQCVSQGRKEAMDDVLDAACAVQRSTEYKSEYRAIATKLVSSIMRGRMEERFGAAKPDGSA